MSSKSKYAKNTEKKDPASEEPQGVELQQVRPKERQEHRHRRLCTVEPAWYRTAEPYRPSMTEYGPHNIDAYINACRKWTKTEFDDFDLDSGEHVIVKKMTKNFGRSDHFISLEQVFVDGALLARYSLLSRRKANVSGEVGYCNRKTTEEQCLLDKVDKVKKIRQRLNEVKPVLQQCFSENHSYSRISHDCVFSMVVDDFVAFGNFFDIKKAKPQTTFLVRRFVPGQYTATMISPFEGCDPLAIFHHSSIDPSKIVQQIIRMTEDYCGVHRDVSNSISRHDWCEYSNQPSSHDESEIQNLDGASAAPTETFGSSSMRLDKKPHLIFFANANFSEGFTKSVQSGLVEQSQEIPELFKVSNVNHNCIALGIDTDVNNSRDWICGKAFQDRKTSKFFALVTNSCLGSLDSHSGVIPLEVKNQFPDVQFTSVKKTGLVFDMDQFKLNECDV